MRAINYRYPHKISKSKPAIIYVFADTHFPFADMDKLKKHIKMCKKEKAGWFHLGDWCEFISPKDRRFDINKKAPAITEQIDMAVDTFEPIKEQGIAVLSGNHEDSIERNYGSVMKGRGGIATLLGVPYLGDMGFVTVKLHRTDTNYFTKTLFMWHGHGGGELLGSKVIKMDRLSHKFDADIHILGHMHTYIPAIPRIIKGVVTYKRHPIITDRIVYSFAVPGYADSYRDSSTPNYVTARAYYPQVIGCVRMEIGVDSVRIEVLE
jgi:predicted phosphodiesterase